MNKKGIRRKMKAYADKLKSMYPTNSEHQQIQLWTTYAYETFLLYIKQWGADDAKRKFVLQEEAFRVPYKLPSGRTIILRGKFDGAFRSPKGKLWLKENKTKGKIDEAGLSQALHSDLQTMFYLIALKQHLGEQPVGFMYDVIRRPLGDRSAIKQRKGGKGRPAETDREFTKRIFYTHEPKTESIYPVAKNMNDWFKRWHVLVSRKDIERFKTECFNPILEQLCDWWDSIKENPFDPWNLYDELDTGGQNPDGSWISAWEPVCPNPLHFRRPFGVYDSLSDGMRGAFFDYIIHDGKSRLKRVKTLYPELE